MQPNITALTTSRAVDGESGVSSPAAVRSFVGAGAPDPACRSEKSTVRPGDEVGPAAFDAGVSACIDGVASLDVVLTRPCFHTCTKASQLKQLLCHGKPGSLLAASDTMALGKG